MKKFLSIAVIASAAGLAQAAPTLDGSLDASYGAALATQNTSTGFGSNNLGQTGYANGSQLDGGYAQVSGGNLYLFFTGCLESNFNKFEVFFDTGIPGQNQLRGDNASVDFNGLNRMAGLKFDTSFTASHWIGMGGGYDGGINNYNLFANAALLLPAGGGFGDYLGSTGGPALGGALGGGNNFAGVALSINNSLNGSSGIELCVPLAFLGNPTTVKVSAFINGSGHDYLANQFLSGTGGSNLGDPSNADLSQQPNDQYFRLAIPTPGAAGIAGLGLLAATRRKR